ncbi:MAG: Gfo/Idh/MocA family oxidoreductase [Cytophagales bacterium]|nr:Gfo/Idh/MocA family oxidoreductase [Bernardetiaceae bacterium]MDW8203955.1 Gfo/Idh/MocA family oxidoreductase [Cytophagales bacterium]
MQTVRWGIMGLGKIARRFAEDLSLTTDNQLVAVASRTRENAQQFAKQYGAKYWFDQFEALACCPEVDIVYIATPHTDHYPLTLLALQQGKHVLCEKPMGINAKEVVAMQQLAAEKRLFLMEALWTRYMPSYQVMLEWLPQIGIIKQLRADFGFAARVSQEHRLMNKAKGGGALLDIGIYPVFLALQVLGIPENISATATLLSSGIDAACQIDFDYPQQGAKALLTCTILQDTASEAVVIGENGNIHMAKPWHSWGAVTLQLTGKPPLTFTPEKRGNGLWLETNAAAQAIRTGKLEEPLMPHAVSLQIAHVLDAIRGQIGLRYSQD